MRWRAAPRDLRSVRFTPTFPPPNHSFDRLSGHSNRGDSRAVRGIQTRCSSTRSLCGWTHDVIYDVTMGVHCWGGGMEEEGRPCIAATMMKSNCWFERFWHYSVFGGVVAFKGKIMSSYEISVEYTKKKMFCVVVVFLCLNKLLTTKELVFFSIWLFTHFLLFNGDLLLRWKGGEISSACHFYCRN